MEKGTGTSVQRPLSRFPLASHQPAPINVRTELALSSDPEMVEQLNKCYIGQLVKMEDLLLLHEKFSKEGLFEFKVTPLGGKLVLLQALGGGDLPSLLRNEKQWLATWVTNIRKWRPTDIARERFILVVEDRGAGIAPFTSSLSCSNSSKLMEDSVSESSDGESGWPEEKLCWPSPPHPDKGDAVAPKVFLGPNEAVNGRKLDLASDINLGLKDLYESDGTDTFVKNGNVPTSSTCGGKVDKGKKMVTFAVDVDNTQIPDLTVGVLKKDKLQKDSCPLTMDLGNSVPGKHLKESGTAGPSSTKKSRCHVLLGQLKPKKKVGKKKVGKVIAKPLVQQSEINRISSISEQEGPSNCDDNILLSSLVPFRKRRPPQKKNRSSNSISLQQFLGFGHGKTAKALEGCKAISKRKKNSLRSHRASIRKASSTCKWVKEVLSSSHAHEDGSDSVKEISSLPSVVRATPSSYKSTENECLISSSRSGVVASKIWSIGKQLGVSFEGRDEEMVRRIQEAEDKDREVALVSAEVSRGANGAQ
ncbi:hypothetical protein RIF29_06531 [Crotalaria pallida]|uniref:Uncharacterized protein n=1 Tax=Crotalaria pallida TaxID=3830 RepID=A0AAN9PAE0_CROPI